MRLHRRDLVKVQHIGVLRIEFVPLIVNVGAGVDGNVGRIGPKGIDCHQSAVVVGLAKFRDGLAKEVENAHLLCVPVLFDGRQKLVPDAAGHGLPLRTISIVQDGLIKGQARSHADGGQCCQLRVVGRRRRIGHKQLIDLAEKFFGTHLLHVLDGSEFVCRVFGPLRHLPAVLVHLESFRGQLLLNGIDVLKVAVAGAHRPAEDPADRRGHLDPLHVLWDRAGEVWPREQVRPLAFRVVLAARAQDRHAVRPGIHDLQ